MARTKQTPRQGSGWGRMARAMFAAPATAGAPTPSTSATTASTSAPTASTSADDGGKCPWSMVPRHRQVPAHAGHIPPPLRITREMPLLE